MASPSDQMASAMIPMVSITSAIYNRFVSLNHSHRDAVALTEAMLRVCLEMLPMIQRLAADRVKPSDAGPLDAGGNE